VDRRGRGQRDHAGTARHLWATPDDPPADRPRLAAFGRRLEQVQITEVRDNIFYAELILDRNTRLTARVSDAVALALHLGIPIHAEDTVLDTVAVSNTVTQVEGDDPAQPDEVEEFRLFLDNAYPEDFDPK
jgi:uncharacterized protein